jgi:hypothetical protein
MFHYTRLVAAQFRIDDARRPTRVFLTRQRLQAIETPIREHLGIVAMVGMIGIVPSVQPEVSRDSSLSG